MAKLRIQGADYCTTAVCSNPSLLVVCLFSLHCSIVVLVNVWYSVPRLTPTLDDWPQEGITGTRVLQPACDYGLVGLAWCTVTSSHAVKTWKWNKERASGTFPLSKGRWFFIFTAPVSKVISSLDLLL